MVCVEAMHSSKVLVHISGEDDDEWYNKLEAMHHSKAEAWCGDTNCTKSKISSQLTRDVVSITFSSCMNFLSGWCKDANSAESKSTIIEHKGGKTCRLSIEEEEPKEAKKVKEDACFTESEATHARDKFLVKQRYKNKKKSSE